jgi:hypothetical protein
MAALLAAAATSLLLLAASMIDRYCSFHLKRTVTLLWRRTAVTAIAATAAAPYCSCCALASSSGVYAVLFAALLQLTGFVSASP